MKKILKLICFLLFFVCTQSIFATENIETKPKISVVVPVYKVEQWLKECMDSLVNQTLKEIEIICVDDGSPDNCGKILDEYAEKDSRVKVIHQKNSGVQKARNAGLDIATGEYITFADSDDYLELNAYEVAYNYAKKDDVDILQFKYRQFYDGKDDYVNKLDLSDSPVISLKEYWQLEQSRTVWNKLFKFEIIQNNNIRFIPGIKPADDTCFSYSALGYVKKVKNIPAKFYNYRLRSDSICNAMNSDEVFINSYKMFKHICDSWRSGNCIENQEDILLSALVRWSSCYHEISLDYAQEVLDSFGEDVYNPETVKKCSKNIQKELNYLELVAKYTKNATLENGVYRIISAGNENKSLAEFVDSKNNVSSFKLENLNKNHKFKIEKNSGGYYTITSLNSGKNISNINKKIRLRKNSKSAQKWYIVPCENNYFNIISQRDFLALDLHNTKTRNSKNNIKFSVPNDNISQKFKFIKVS